MWRSSTIRSVLVALAMIGLALALERFVPALTGALRVVDGDSLELGAERIRLDGIDAPELGQNCGPADKLWPCGRAAREALRRATARGPGGGGGQGGGQEGVQEGVQEGGVSCRPVDSDRYGRAVSVCTANGHDLARLMVEQGLAVATGFAYRREEDQARAAKRGIWSGPFEPPAQWRARHP